jgi:hypothetical protein
MRGYKIRQLAEFDPLGPTLSATAPCVGLPPTSLSVSPRESEFVRQQTPPSTAARSEAGRETALTTGPRHMAGGFLTNWLSQS